MIEGGSVVKASDIFGRSKSVIGMIHVGALPGTPFAREGLGTLVKRAASEAKMLSACGFDCLMIENMHDRPYVHGDHGPETVAAMTAVGLAVRDAAPKQPLGVQILSGGNKEAIAVAQAIGAAWIRCENFVFSHVADEGLLPKAEAGDLLRYRRSIGADGVRVFADVKKKHASHAITADVSLAEAVEASVFFGADGVIVSGSATGKPVELEDLQAARRATTLPVLVGSGVRPESAKKLFAFADALIVGSYYKRGGTWGHAPDKTRCRRLIQAVEKARRDD